MAATKNGVYYDFSKSIYRVNIDNYTFVFSSKLHMEKFKKKRKEHAEKINASLSKRFNLLVDVTALSDMVLYRKIESRGFLVINEGEEVCQRNMEYVGGKLTKKRLKE